MSSFPVVSFYDFTGNAVRPWAEAGHTCIAVDIMHTLEGRVETFPSGGEIHYMRLDLHNIENVRTVLRIIHPRFVFAFPACTDLSVIGTRHWKAKADRDPFFQLKAFAPILDLEAELKLHPEIRFVIENPRGLLPRVWRNPDYIFSPNEFGGYLPLDDVNPLSELLPPRDAYKKTTCLWTSPNFIFPPKKEVPAIGVEHSAQGSNIAHIFDKLGGKSFRTKAIRSATPRGFARAVYLANTPKDEINDLASASV